MRVWKTRRHVESESIIIVHVLISNLNELVPTLDNDLLLKNWVKHWIHFVFDGLNEDGESFLKWPFESISQVWMIECHNTVLLLENRLSDSDPVNGLPLRINHEWISGRSRDHNTILNGQFIGREAFQVPLTNSGLINQELSQGKALRHRHVFGQQIIMEVLIQQLCSKLRIKRTALRHEGACFGHITDEPLFQALKLVCTLDPTFFVIL